MSVLRGWKALNDRPSTPRAIVDDDDLTYEQKSRMLLAWEADALALEVATAEGMPNGGPSHLDEVRRAMIDLHVPHP